MSTKNTEGDPRVDRWQGWHTSSGMTPDEEDADQGIPRGFKPIGPWFHYAISETVDVFTVGWRRPLQRIRRSAR